ncbi:MAG: arsenite methyltransferase [Candidatus Dormibacteria bacterium]
MCPANPDIRELVRRGYAEAATRLAAAQHHPLLRSDRKSCCGPSPAGAEEQGQVAFGAGLYSAEAGAGAIGTALAESLGCGVPTAGADLRPGETVLDLGSGAGADALISARRVLPGGWVIGLDMTTEMLELARQNAYNAGVTNVEFIEGYLEAMPLPAESVDVVISNCVINLAANKQVVLSEAARVLRPNGRFAISDVIADRDMDDATRTDSAQLIGCIAGALTEPEYRAALTAAGFVDIEITATHRVHTHAASAVVRARKPSARGD